MLKIIVVDKDTVYIQLNYVYYQDSRSNFILDNGVDIEWENIDYNSQVGHCLINGELQSYPNQKLEALAEKLDDLLSASKDRTYIPPTLEEIKNMQIEDLKSNRDEAEQQPVTTDKGTFDVDSKSLERINGAITVLGITQGTIEWTLADNTVVTVNAGDLTNVIIALAQQSNSVHEKYRQLKEQVLACETVEQVEAIVW